MRRSGPIRYLGLAGTLVLALGAPLWQRAIVHLGSPVAMRVVGRSECPSGSRTAFRVICADPRDGRPRSGATIDATLSLGGPNVLATCRTLTGPTGEAPVELTVPSGVEGPLQLAVSATSRGPLWSGTDRVFKVIQAVRASRILLSTDRPLYQPGQTIHIRCLALALPSARPLAGSSLVIEVHDPKGNKLFKQEERVSEFGVAAASFRLADVLTEGEYRIRAAVLDGSGSKPSGASERTVGVRRYVLPKFKVVISTARPFYHPGETIRVTVEARYLFGKPVAGTARVEIGPGAAGSPPLRTGQGNLDPDGRIEVSLPLPAGSALLPAGKDPLPIRLRARVTDTAGHEQEASTSLAVSRGPFTLEAIAEAGSLVPGVENIVYVVVTSPDGAPVPGARVTAAGRSPPRGLGPPIRRGAGVTDAGGIAEIRIVPRGRVESWDLVVEAGGVTGRSTVRVGSAASASPTLPLQIAVFTDTAGDGMPLVRVLTSNRIDGSPVRTRVGIPALGVLPAGFASEHELRVERIPERITFEVEDESHGRRVFDRDMSPEALADALGRLAPFGSRRRGPAEDDEEDEVPACASILLRTDDGIYKVGDFLGLEVLSSSSSGTVYLDAVREGQTLLLGTVELSRGRARSSITLTADMIGTIHLCAYRLLEDGSVTRSSKVVVVGANRALSVSARTARPTYRPGETARVMIRVTDDRGRPVQAALGIDVVDEAVFALSDPVELSALTAFVTLQLLAAGEAPAEVEPSLRYLEDRAPDLDDPYVLGLVTNVMALVPGRKAQAVELARRLVRMGAARGFVPGRPTLVLSSGEAGEAETISLTAQALIALGVEGAVARELIRRLIALKDPSGRWLTTMATVLALKTLLEDKRARPATGRFTGFVDLRVDGRRAARVPVSDRTYDVVQLVDLERFAGPGDHDVELISSLSSPQPFAVQIVWSCYLPWGSVAVADAAPEGSLVARRTLDRTSLTAGGSLGISVELSSRAGAVAPATGSAGSMLLAELGTPPGFDVETTPLDSLVRAGKIFRYEIEPGRLVLYLPGLAPGRSVAFGYTLAARIPVRALMPPSSVYEYYNPKNLARIAPVAIDVR